jgi:hypothetical protein
MKARRVFLGLLLAGLVLSPGRLAAQTAEELRLRKISLGVGAAVGVGLGITNAILLFGYTEGPTVGEKLLILTPSFMAGVAGSMLATAGLFELFLDIPMKWYVALPVGALAGLLEGALVGGATYGTFFGVACSLDPEFMNLPSWWESVARGTFGGAVSGATVGLAAGAVAGLALSLLLSR